MLPCPEEDWTSNSTEPVNEQVAALLIHYENTHCDNVNEDVRELLKACAKVLDPEGSKSLTG